MQQSALPLSVLVVASRPANVAPRNVDQHLESVYDALEEAGDQIALEWLWPPTFRAIEQRLADTDAPRVSMLYLDAPLETTASGVAICLQAPD